MAHPMPARAKSTGFIKHLLSDQHETGVERDTKESEIKFFPWE